MKAHPHRPKFKCDTGRRAYGCDGTPYRYLVTREPDPVTNVHRFFVLCKYCYEITNPAFKQITRKITKAEYLAAQIMLS
jgi:hypothetical protein